MTELEIQTSKNWGSKRWLVRKRTPEGCCCCTICLYTYLLCSAVDKHDFSTLTHRRLQSSAICVNFIIPVFIIIIYSPRLNFSCYHIWSTESRVIQPVTLIIFEMKKELRLHVWLLTVTRHWNTSWLDNTNRPSPQAYWNSVTSVVFPLYIFVWRAQGEHPMLCLIV